MEWLGLPMDASADGGSIDLLILLVHILMAVLFVGWSIFFVYVLLRFRKGRNPEASYKGAKGKYSKYAEVGVVLAEAVLLVMAVVFWIPLKASPPDSSQERVEVHVIAEQFAWNIHYPGPDGKFGERRIDLVSADNTIGLDRESPGGADDIIAINQLHLPVGRPALVRLSSKDVIHSFFLPQMRVKQDAIPGLEFPVYFTPVKEGQWEIACAQLCGLGHYRMRGFLTIHDEAGYEAWLEEQASYL